MEYCSPKTGNPLRLENDKWIDVETNEVVASVQNGIARFVPPEKDYADSFGFQWNRWENALSGSRGGDPHHVATVHSRSGLWDGAYDTKGKTLLECGMGGGDDTEVLLTLDLKEIHSFDISTSVDRAAKHLHDDRLRITQASIFEIPYPDASFDIVWCHRVVQHTPDPEKAIRCVCRKVKPGGFLFLHSYKRSKTYMAEFRYRYRWLTSNLPKEVVFQYLEICAPLLHPVRQAMSKNAVTEWIAYRFLPYYKVPAYGAYKKMTLEQKLAWEKLVTFDALTPRYDNPMTTETFTRIIKEEGFEIQWLHDPPINPLLARAIKTL